MDGQTAESAAEGKPAGKAVQAKAAPPKTPKAQRMDVLDRSRHFSTDYSATGQPAVAHWQDGRPYDSQGNRIRRSGDDELDKRLAKEEKDRTQARLNRAKEVVRAIEAGEDPEPDENSLNGVNLFQWAKGDVKYRFGLVRQAIESRYQRSVHNEVDAREFLIDQKVVTVGDVRRFLNRDPVIVGDE